MKKLIFLNLLLIVFVNKTISAQKNSAYIELGGAGIMGSLNYEREVITDSKLILRGGLGYLSTFEYEGLNIPITAYSLIDLSKGNYLEFGIGYTFLVEESNEEPHTGFVVPAIGYRIYNKRKAGFFKITFNPLLFNDTDSFRVFPWAGVTYGISF